MAVLDALIEHRRWLILDAIAQMNSRMLNEQIILSVVSRTGVPIGAEEVRNDLLLMEQAGCLKVERIDNPGGRALWVATLTREGLEVRDCHRTVHGVASHRPV